MRGVTHCANASASPAAVSSKRLGLECWTESRCLLDLCQESSETGLYAEFFISSLPCNPCDKHIADLQGIVISHLNEIKLKMLAKPFDGYNCHPPVCSAPSAAVWAGLVRMQDHSRVQVSVSHISPASCMASADFKCKPGGKGRKLQAASSNRKSFIWLRCFSILEAAVASLRLLC